METKPTNGAKIPIGLVQKTKIALRVGNLREAGAAVHTKRRWRFVGIRLTRTVSLTDRLAPKVVPAALISATRLLPLGFASRKVVLVGAPTLSVGRPGSVTELGITTQTLLVGPQMDVDPISVRTNQILATLHMILDVLQGQFFLQVVLLQ